MKYKIKKSYDALNERISYDVYRKWRLFFWRYIDYRSSEEKAYELIELLKEVEE